MPLGRGKIKKKVKKILQCGEKSLPKSRKRYKIFCVYNLKTWRKIPENATLIFYYYYSCFQGSEQDQYTVFLFEDECAEWLAENNFNKEKNEVFEKAMAAGIEDLGREQISKFYYPDFTSEYLWLEAKRTYFVYNKETKAIYVLEVKRKIKI